MRVFLRYITKSMLEKKGRFFLLIFSIMISTALFVFSMGAVDVILDGYTDELKSMADGMDVGIYSDTDERFFDENDIDPAGLYDLEGYLTALGVIVDEDDNVRTISIRGCKDCNKYVTEGNIPTDSNEPICVISERVADGNDYTIGSKITLSIGGQPKEFTVKAISAPKGMFSNDDKNDYRIAVPYEYLNELLDAGGKYSVMAAKCDGDSVKAAEKFNDANPDYSAESLFDLSMYKTMISSTESTVYIMFAIVCVICCIIIHGAFKLIITERMTVIGTFMSQGATRKKISHILLMESFLYALFGAIFGVALGEVVLYFVNRIASPLSEYGIYMDFHIRPMLIISGILFAVVMSVISAWMPVRSVKKLPVKDVILNRLESKHKKGMIRFTLGVILFAFSIFGAFCKASWTNDLSIVLISASMIGLIMLLRKFLKFASGALSKVFRKQTSVFLALNNIKSSKLLRGNVTLLVISLSSILMIASVGTSLVGIVKGAYEGLSYDYSISGIVRSDFEETTTDTIIGRLNDFDFVEKDSITSFYYAQGFVDKEMVIFEGADPEKYADYNEYLELKKSEYKKYIDELASSADDTVMITEWISKTTGKGIGDTITVDVDGKKYDFNIIGVYDGKLYNNGRVILTKSETIQNYFHVQEAGNITFKVNCDKETADAKLKGHFSDLGAIYTSRDEQMEDNIESNDMLIKLLSIFSYLAMIVASIGIFNNIAISFQQRRREFAVMASIGMNAKKRKRLVFTENMFCVFWSIVISLPYTLLVSKLISKVLKYINIPMTVEFDWASVPKYSIVLAVIIFIASLSTMKKSKKINVVQELKYE